MPGRLVWSDEFDGPAGSPPDRSVWSAETGGGGWGNDEIQTYTDDPANACLDGQGNLVIRALRDGDRITSARLVTRGLVGVGHGRIEVRARVPAGAGLWSAFWMLGAGIDRTGWPGCGEIDVMEVVGADPERVFGTTHSPGRFLGSAPSGGVRSARPLSEAFHDYAVDWAPDRIDWRLDGRPYFSVDRATLGPAFVFAAPMYLLVNLAVGGSLGGPLADDTPFPASLVLAHVRVHAP
jgi:beta-glucanase (GH16 family)